MLVKVSKRWKANSELGKKGKSGNIIFFTHVDKIYLLIAQLLLEDQCQWLQSWISLLELFVFMMVCSYSILTVWCFVCISPCASQVQEDAEAGLFYYHVITRTAFFGQSGNLQGKFHGLAPGPISVFIKVNSLCKCCNWHWFIPSDASESDPVRFIASLRDHPDPPRWLRFIQESPHDDAYLYGTPLSTSDSAELEVSTSWTATHCWSDCY